MNELLTLSAPLTGGSPEGESAEFPVQGDAPEPLERLEARICELAGHLTAATCQFLLLIADFDERHVPGAVPAHPSGAHRRSARPTATGPGPRAG